jgi:branched-chain amino acid transport system substrate-binding protein
MKRAVLAGAAGAVLALAAAIPAAAADIKIGTIYDLTGPFAGGGSKPASIGNKIAIDMVNEKGGVEGNKIVAVEADAQSKVDVAINEAERLLNEVKVDLIMGV